MTIGTDYAQSRIAVYIDIENFYMACKNKNFPFDLTPIFEKLKEYGRISMRNSYGDLEQTIFDGDHRKRIRKMLQRFLVKHQDIAYLTERKNTADMALTVEALTVCHLYSDINIFTFLAQDRDYVPLMVELKGLGKTVIGVAVSEENTHALLKEACDHLFYYEQMIPEITSAAIHVSQPKTDSKLGEYVELLERAINALNDQGLLTCGAKLAPYLRQLQPDFDPKQVNAKTFKEFIEMAQQKDAVEVDWQGHVGDYIVTLPGKRITAQPGQLALSDTKKQKPEQLYKHYRWLLEKVLKISIPSIEDRRQILDSLKAVIKKQPESSQGIYLKDWSFAALESLRDRGIWIDQKIIYKVLWSLYLQDCFISTVRDDFFDPYVELRIDPNEWESTLHVGFLRAISVEDVKVNFTEEAVSLFLFGDDKHLEEAKKLIAVITRHK